MGSTIAGTAIHAEKELGALRLGLQPHVSHQTRKGADPGQLFPRRKSFARSDPAASPNTRPPPLLPVHRAYVVASSSIPKRQHAPEQCSLPGWRCGQDTRPRASRVLWGPKYFTLGTVPHGKVSAPPHQPSPPRHCPPLPRWLQALAKQHEYIHPTGYDLLGVYLCQDQPPKGFPWRLVWSSEQPRRRTTDRNLDTTTLP